MPPETQSVAAPLEKLEKGEVKLSLLPHAISQVMPLTSDTAVDVAELSSLILCEGWAEHRVVCHVDVTPSTRSSWRGVKPRSP